MVHHDNREISTTTTTISLSSQPWASAQHTDFQQEANVPVPKMPYPDYRHNNSSWETVEPMPRLSVSTLSDDSITAISTDRHPSLSNDDISDEQPPSKRQLLAGHIRSLTIVVIKFLMKNNNWALVVNLVHHLWGARKFIINKAPKWGGSVAHDVSRVAGTMHLAFATLAGLALKRKRLSTDRSTLLVLVLVAVGQAYTSATAFWQSGAAWTAHAIRQSGLLDVFIFVVSSLAYSKTFRRSGRLI